MELDKDCIIYTHTDISLNDLKEELGQVLINQNKDFFAAVSPFSGTLRY